jgi:hypothetical protein
MNLAVGQGRLLGMVGDFRQVDWGGEGTGGGLGKGGGAWLG